jgi:hypothetical protein
MTESSKYDWNHASQQEAGEYAEKLPNGKHPVEITRVVFGKKDGALFKSKGGDPQIMLIFADELGREAFQVVTLSFKAGFILAKILEAAGADLDRMTADGVTPKSFAEPEFAVANLVGRQLEVEVVWSSKNGKDFADITPLGTITETSDYAPVIHDGSDDIPI